MKKGNLILVMAFFSAVLMAQPQAPNRIDSQGKKQGEWRKFKDGVLLYEGRFKDDVPIGEFKYYHPNGSLKSISVFIQGAHEVKTTIFHPNGQKASEGRFLDQLKDGEWNYWNENGGLISVENYAKGKKNGVWKVFSAQTGILLEELNYKNELLDGVSKTFYTDGKPCTVDHFIMGKRYGEAISYFIDGVVSIKGEYKDNLRIGEWEYYDQGGRLRKIVHYDRSHEISTYLFFYNRSQQIKLNQEAIAYFLFQGNKTVIYTVKGEIMTITDDAEIVTYWADFFNFVPVSPKIHAAHQAVKSYVTVDEETIEVFLQPQLPYPVYSKGDKAEMVKMLFPRELPKLE